MIVPKKIFKQHLITLQAALPNDKYIKSIILTCNLQPISWREWTTGEGLKLNFTNKLNISKCKIRYISDIYFNLKPSSLLNQSKVIGCREGYIFILGNDSRLRVFKDEQRVSNLVLGIEALKDILDFTWSSENYSDTMCKFPVDYLDEKAGDTICHKLLSLIEGC